MAWNPLPNKYFKSRGSSPCPLHKQFPRLFFPPSPRILYLIHANKQEYVIKNLDISTPFRAKHSTNHVSIDFTSVFTLASSSFSPSLWNGFENSTRQTTAEQKKKQHCLKASAAAASFHSSPGKCKRQPGPVSNNKECFFFRKLPILPSLQV